MKKGSYAKKGAPLKVNPDYFTGRAVIEQASGTPAPIEGDVFHVKFYAGARAKLHEHAWGQLLICTGGYGSMRTYSKSGRGRSSFAVRIKDSVRLSKGDMIYIKPNTIHDHGSVKKGETFSHIAINFSRSGRSRKDTTWYESENGHVTGILR